MVKESNKGYLAVALDMAGFTKDDIELALRSFDFITSKVTEAEALDFLNNKGYIHEGKKEGGK